MGGIRLSPKGSIKYFKILINSEIKRLNSNLREWNRYHIL